MKNVTLFVLTVVLSLGCGQMAHAVKQIETKIVQEKKDQWVVTAYSDSYKCNGKWGPVAADGGDRLQWGMIAADWSVLPPGTRVKIEGFGDQIFVVKDKGRAIKGKKIDLYIPNVSQKKLGVWGRQKLRIEVIKENQRVAKKIDTEDHSLFKRYAFIPPKKNLPQTGVVEEVAVEENLDETENSQSSVRKILKMRN